MLNGDVFKTLDEIVEQTDVWVANDNEVMQHDSLVELIPVEYRILHDPDTSRNGWHWLGRATPLPVSSIESCLAYMLLCDMLCLTHKISDKLGAFESLHPQAQAIEQGIP